MRRARTAARAGSLYGLSRHIVLVPIVALCVVSFIDVDTFLYTRRMAWTVGNYVALLNDPDFLNTLWSSIIVSSASALFAAVSGAAILYLSLLARSFKAVFTLLISARLLPAAIVAPPAAYILSSGGLLDTYIGTAIFLFPSLVIFFVILTIGPSQCLGGSIISELRLLGAGDADIVRILIVPVIGPSALAGFLICWCFAFQEYYLTNFLLSSPGHQSFAVFVARGMTQHEIGYGRFAAAAFLGATVTLFMAAAGTTLLVRLQVHGSRHE